MQRNENPFFPRKVYLLVTAYVGMENLNVSNHKLNAIGIELMAWNVVFIEVMVPSAAATGIPWNQRFFEYFEIKITFRETVMCIFSTSVTKYIL